MNSSKKRNLGDDCLFCGVDIEMSITRFIAAVLTLLCTFSNAYTDSTISLRDVSTQTGITFVHTDGRFGRKYMMETVTAGLALFDYDGDGDIDIYFLNGGILPGTNYTKTPRNALYRNDGNWKFTDVTEQAGVGLCARAACA